MADPLAIFIGREQLMADPWPSSLVKLKRWLTSGPLIRRKQIMAYRLAIITGEAQVMADSLARITDAMQVTTAPWSSSLVKHK